jgi:hypothetical protein
LESYVANNFQLFPFILVSCSIKKEKTKHRFRSYFQQRQKEKDQKKEKGGNKKRISFNLIFNKDKKKNKKKEKNEFEPFLVFCGPIFIHPGLCQFSMLCFVYCVGDPVCLFFFLLVIFVGIFFVG